MSFSYKDLTVRSRDGRRVPMTDCKLEPLNLLIPGNAPIVVPKRSAWRSPSQQQAKNNNNNNNNNTTARHRRHKLNLEAAPQDDYDDADADEEEKTNLALDDDSDNDTDTQSLIKNTRHKGDHANGKCKKDSIVKDKAKEAKHRRKAERHQQRAEREREEAAGEHARLQKRIARQESYIAKLRARYANAGEVDDEDDAVRGTKTSSFKTKKKPASNKKPYKVSFSSSDTEGDDGATTDGSAAVSEMLANMKIRAGGKENPRFWAQPGDLPWNVSDDSQLIALKNSGDNNNNSYAVIGECMGRRAGEVKRRYKYLKDCDFKIPGGDETTEAEQTGGEMTDDAGKTDDENKDGGGGGETTDAEKPDVQVQSGGDGDGDGDGWNEETDTQLWKLKNDGKTWAEIHAIMGGSKSGAKDRYKHLKSIDFKLPDETAAESDAPGAEKPAADDKDDDNNKQNEQTAANSGPAWGGDFMAMASAYVEKQMQDAAQVSSSSSHKSSSKKDKKSNKHNTKCQHASPPHGEPVATAAAAAPAGFFFPGTNAYIAQYARTLLAEANAGRATIPEPDEIFDEDDCILLALADSRRRENRWLEIQADYFNLTGRMVPQELLRWKLGGGGGGGGGSEA